MTGSWETRVVIALATSSMFVQPLAAQPERGRVVHAAQGSIELIVGSATTPRTGEIGAGLRSN